MIMSVRKTENMDHKVTIKKTDNWIYIFCIYKKNK